MAAAGRRASASSRAGRSPRTYFFYVATVNTPAMAAKMVGRGSQYAFISADKDGEYLDGGKTYLTGGFHMGSFVGTTKRARGSGRLVDERDERVEHDRLDEVVVEPRLLRAAAVLLPAVTRHGDDDRRPTRWLTPEPSGHLVAVHAG